MAKKIVDFYAYCSKCLHSKKSEDEAPCCDCLNEPVKDNGKIPVYFKAEEEKK